TAIIVIIEQFGYGIGFTAFMIFLMTVAFDPYKTSHYALSTGLMALGMMLPGTFSGYLQSALGYSRFFLLVTLLTIPGMILLRFIPLPEKESS
ncbi:MAG: MFS transporter, partial [candidate division KSB1 bacterium]|nr:MFS transporter [candidate division KSB1 bacterium]